MKRTLTVLALITVALGSARADPAPACTPTNEQFNLAPTTATFNGQPATPSTPGSFVYTTDAGTQFYGSPSGQLDVVPVDQVTTCPTPADEVTLKLTDPWTGELITLTVKGSP